MRFLEVCDSINTFHNPRLFQALLKVFWLGKKKITWKIKILASLCKTGSYIFFRGSWYSGWSLVSQLDCPTLCDPMDCSMPGFPVLTNFRSILKLMSIESVMPSTHLILCCPLLLLPSIFLRIRVFSNESVLCIRWPKYQSFSFSISPSNEYSGLISFRMDWFDSLTVQGTLKSPLQYHGSKASILQHLTFFTVQLSHPYMTTGKTIALTRWIFGGKVMSLLFNMLSSLVIVFLSRSNCLLISWLKSLSAVLFGVPKSKVCHYFHCFPIYLPWSDGTRCHNLKFLNVGF